MTNDNASGGARAITAGVAGLWASAFGKGPEMARTYFADDNVVVVMHGGLLPYEQTLVDAGEHELVRAVRQRFELTLAPEFRRTVEEATGRRVATFGSHMVFDPTRTFELFVLDGDPPGST